MRISSGGFSTHASARDGNPGAFVLLPDFEPGQCRDASNRFLADFRKMPGDCIAENHYRTFAELAHEHKLGIHPESGGPHAGPFDGLQCTSIGPHWNDVLWAAQKPSFDHEACSGVNLCFLHTFTCSPKEMGLPGQEYFAGTHINPNVTWWEMAGPFMEYLARCQYLLRQGRFVADVCHYVGDHVPNIAPLKEADPARILPGYDYDFLSEEILQRMTVEDGRLALPGGMRYRVLSLPDHKVMSIAALEAVARLVRAGATIVGPKPERTASLTDYPRCDERLIRLSEELWGSNPGESGRRTVGRGQVIWGKTARTVLADDRVTADFEYQTENKSVVLDYIHRRLEDRDIYFVSNQSEQEVETDCLFRVAGGRAELWNPLTGEIRAVRSDSQTGGRTRLSIPFAPYGSWFVVFRCEGVPPASFATGATVSFLPLEGPWQVTFVSPWGDTFEAALPELLDWAAHSDDRIRYHSGKGVYEHTFEMPAGNGARLLLDLGRVEDVGIARVFLNDRDLGIVWTKPFRVDISAAAKPGTNQLRVEVVNSWRNRLIRDHRLPPGRARSATNITVTESWKLVSSGLLGPVTIRKEAEANK